MEEISDALADIRIKMATIESSVFSAHKRIDENSAKLEAGIELLRNRWHDHDGALQTLLNDQKYDKIWKDEMKQSVKELSNDIKELTKTIADNKQKHSIKEALAKNWMWLASAVVLPFAFLIIKHFLGV